MLAGVGVVQVGGALVFLALFGLLWPLGAARRRARARRHRTRSLVLLLSVVGAEVVAAVALLPLLLAVWTASGDRSPMPEAPLAQGVTYERLALADARPVVVHVVRADTTVDGVEIVVSDVETAPDPGPGVYHRATLARGERTSSYVERSGVAAAINASFFDPFREFPPWSAYPGVGDVVYPLGFIVRDGKVHGEKWGDATLSILSDGQIVVGELAEGAVTAISGRRMLLADGVAVDEVFAMEPASGAATTPYARTALAADSRTGIVYLVVVDGKQPGYSEGLTLAELAGLLAELGATDAIELDGGGSATIAVNRDGSADVLNRTINTRIPGRERVVANQVGVKACPVDGCGSR